MLAVLGDLIADITMHLPLFPVQAGDVLRLSYLDIGPGGGCNTAIMAARLGLAVETLGEVGDDKFGLIVQDGLALEGIGTSGIVVTPNATTPVAGVLVDRSAEPAYVGNAGSLQLREPNETMLGMIANAKALYADGWAEYQGVEAMVLIGFQQAKKAGVPVFFDPGPGNPDVTNSWQNDALTYTTVLLANQTEARRLSGKDTDDAAAAALLAVGPELVVLKRGAEGVTLYRKDATVFVPGFSVPAVDQTGAGDSLSGAVIYAWLKNVDLETMGRLANATGAAKVQKRGTGHSMPTVAEIRAVLTANGLPSDYLPNEAN
jgi:sugar/nucleoside kinase (ribokinase family)